MVRRSQSAPGKELIIFFAPNGAAICLALGCASATAPSTFLDRVVPWAALASLTLASFAQGCGCPVPPGRLSSEADTTISRTALAAVSDGNPGSPGNRGQRSAADSSD